MRLLLLCLVLFLGTTVMAAPKKPPKKDENATREQAAQLYQKAEENYKLQKYEDALQGFTEAYRLANEPALLFNIAQCQRLLGRLEDAKRSYQTFLKDAPNSVLRANADARIAELDGEIKRLASKGSIKISSEQNPTEVFLDGVSKGPSPLTLFEVEPGAHKITVKKAGFLDYNVTITVEPGVPSEINVPALNEPGINKSKLLFISSASLGGLAVLSSGGFVGLGLLSIKEQKSPTPQSDLAAEIKRIEKRASFSKGLGYAAVGMLGGAAISAGVGYLLKKRANKETTPELTPSSQGSQP